VAGAKSGNKKEVNNTNEHLDKEIHVTASDSLQERMLVNQLAVGSWQLAKEEARKRRNGETKTVRRAEGQCGSEEVTSYLLLFSVNSVAKKNRIKK
jgi:hypothetical protein